MLYLVLLIFVIPTAIATYFLVRTFSTTEEPLIPFTLDDAAIDVMLEKALRSNALIESTTQKLLAFGEKHFE